eukprot:scaffold32003_cov64-Attheya_sp.AAC.1
MISSRSSRKSNTSSMLATVCSSALLLIAFLCNHVTDASCFCIPPPDDPCPALQATKLLVRATIIGQTEVVDETLHFPHISNHYSVKIEEVYVNAGAPNVIEGQTIQVTSRKAGSLCGTTLQTGSDMLLDLSPESNGEQFSTMKCSMNSRIDANGAIMRSGYSKCFENTTIKYEGAWLLQQFKVDGVLAPLPEHVVISLRKKKDATGPGEYTVALFVDHRFWTQIKIESLPVSDGQKRVDQIVHIADYDMLPSMDNGVADLQTMDNLVATAFSTLTQIELRNNGNLQLSSSADGDTTFLCELIEHTCTNHFETKFG